MVTVGRLAAVKNYELLIRSFDYVLKNSEHDEIRLNIVNGGEAIPMKLNGLQTGVCRELRQRLTRLIGEEGLKVESLKG